VRRRLVGVDRISHVGQAGGAGGAGRLKLVSLGQHGNAMHQGVQGGRAKPRLEAVGHQGLVDGGRQLGDQVVGAVGG